MLLQKRVAEVHVRSVNRQIFHALLSIASAALLIRVMGMLNQIVVTARFGGGAAMDAYFVASLLPLLLAQLISSGIEASVIPVYTHVCTTESKRQASELFSAVLNVLGIMTALLTLVMIMFSKEIIFLVAPALDPYSMELATNLALLIFPVLFLSVMAGFLECILNTEGLFGWPAYAGMLVPLTTVILVVLAAKTYGIAILCLGMVLGLCLQLGVCIVLARKVGLVYLPFAKWRTPAMRAIQIAAWPVLIGALISQAGPLVDQIFASFLSPGSISALNYALKLVGVPTGVIFISVGRAALPYLSRQIAAHDMQAFKGTLNVYLWIVGISTALLSVIMFLFAHQLVQILFQRGSFSSVDTNHTAITLMGFIVGLTPMSLGFILARAFSALGKNKVLMSVSAFSIIANAFFDYIFAHFWQSFGIALATSAVYFCTMLILLLTLRHTIGELGFVTPPSELFIPLRRLPMLPMLHQYKLLIQKRLRKHSLLNISYKRQRMFMRMSIALAVFSMGVVGVLLNSFYMLRVSFGSLIVLFFLRYRYILLLVWVLLSVFIGSSLQIFNGDNFLTALSVPTLLIMLCIPFGIFFKRLSMLQLLCVYLLWVLAGIGISPLGMKAFLTLWITFLDYVAVVVLTMHVLTTRKRVDGLIDAMLLVIAFVSLYGMYGYFTRHNGIVDPTTGVFRIYSIFTAPPPLALLLSLVVPLALYRLITSQGIRRVGYAMLLLIFLVTIGLTFTRSAFIVVPLCIIPVLFFLPSQKLKRIIFSSVLVLIVIVFLLGTVGHVPIFNRFFNSDILTLNGRTYLWQALLDHFDPTHLMGYGLQASDILLANLQVSNKGMGVIGTAPHNLFLGALYDHGIIGAALLLLVFIVLFSNLIKGIRHATGEHRILYAMVLATYLSMLVQSLASNDLWNQEIGMYFWIIMALPFAQYWFQSSSQAQIVPKEDHMRLCYISFMFSPIVGGAEARAEKQARQLQALGHEVTIVTLRHNKNWKRKEDLHGLPVVRVGGLYNRRDELRAGRYGHLLIDLYLFLTLWRLRHTFDVIHVFQLSPLAAVAQLLGWCTGKPVLISVQSSGPDKQRLADAGEVFLMADTLTETDFLKIDTAKKWLIVEGDIFYLSLTALGGRFILNFLRSSNAFYQTLSKRSYGYLLEHGFREEQIVHIPGSVDTEKFKPDPVRQENQAALRRTIVCVAGLEYAKGVDVLLHAWSRMMSMSTGWGCQMQPRLLLVGDGALRPQLELLSMKLGIESSVEFLGQRVNIVDLLQQSWGFVLPSRWEGMPNALLEAMACGLPCIATNVSGSEDAISNENNGLLVKSEHPEDMANALQRIILDSDLAKKLGQEARATIVCNYQLPHIVDQCLTLYRDILRKEQVKHKRERYKRSMQMKTVDSVGGNND